MNKSKFGLSLLAITGIFLIMSACNSNNGNTSHEAVITHEETNTVSKAVCVMTPTEGSNVNGVITFTQTDAGILVVADIEGLTEGNHGFHIHEWGDITKSDGTSAGGHFNPAETEHAGPEDAIRHAGDLGNLTADADGKAHYERTDSLISFTGKHNIIGRSIIIHTGEDDLVSQPVGNAGAREAHGVIGIAK